MCVCVCLCVVDLHLYCTPNQLDVLPPRKSMMSCFESYEKQRERAAGKTVGLNQLLHGCLQPEERRVNRIYLLNNHIVLNLTVKSAVRI